MAVLIIYGSIEGQTEKIAKFVAEKARDAGENVVLFDTADRLGTVSFDGIDKVVLAASVHESRHPKPFEVFVASSREDLSKRPTLLLSISLNAAFEEGQELAQGYLDEMKMRTGLTTDQDLLVAGAIHSDSYDHYASQVLRHVILADRDFDPSVRDHEFTDWDAVASTVTAFLEGKAAA